MVPYWLINEASPAGFGEAQRGAAATQPTSAETNAPFLNQIDQVLGEESEPDSEFFVDSWTVGIAAASENLQRRQKAQKNREHETPAWFTYSRYTPLFVASAEPSVEKAWPYRRAHAAGASIPNRHWYSEVEKDDWQATDEIEMDRPLTVDSACRVLGVAITSTREQIRAAYRKMAGRYHPDRLAQCGAHEQKQASDRMAQVNQAYRLLCTELAERTTASRIM